MKTPQYTTDDIVPLERRYHRARALSAFAIIALCVLFCWANLTEATGSWVRLAVQTLPLALFLPGIWRDHHRTYSWLCFVVLFYFTALVVAAMGPQSHWADYLGVTLSVVLFCTAMMASRWCQHARLARDQNASITEH